MAKAQGHITVRRRPKDGTPGDDAYRLDLNNENDSLLYDGEGHLLSGSVVTVATLYKGGVAVGNATFAISERSGCTAQQATISGNTVTVTGISASGYVMVSATYDGHTYYAKFSLKRLVGTVKYDLVVSPDAVGYNSSTGAKTASTINVKVYRTAQNDSGGTTRALVTAIPTGYTLKVDNVDRSSSYGNSGYTFNVDTTKTSHVVTLLQGTTVADEETVPIAAVEDGADGEDGLNSTIVFLYKRAATAPSIDWNNDLTYNFDNKALTSVPQGWSATIPANDGKPLYVTAATAASRTNTDTIAPSEWASPVEMVTNGIDGTDGTDGTDGNDGLNAATVALYKRAASSPAKPTSALTYTFATGVLSGSGTNPLAGWTQAMPEVDGNPCWRIQATAIGTGATDTIASSEWSAPAKVVIDGEDGENAVRLDLNNENDSMLYDAEGNLLSGSVTTDATLYDGDTAVDSGVTYSIQSSSSGITASISGNTVTVSAATADGYVIVAAAYGGKTYTSKFTIKRIVGSVKYDLLVTPDAIAYNTTTGTKSASQINVKIYRTAQNNSGGVTRSLMTSIPTGYTLKVDGTAVSSGYGNSGYTFNVDTTKSSHVVSLLQSTTTVDEETVPINKSTDGTDGDDGENAIRLDLNNENDSLLYDAEGNLLSGSVASVATLYDGEDAVSSGVSYSISDRSGCSSSQATISGNTITVSGINSSGYVMVKATYNGNDYYAKFSLKKIIGDVKYDLFVTPDAVAYNTTTGAKSASQINVKVMRTAQTNNNTVERTIVSTMPTGFSLKVDGTAVTYPGSSGLSFNVDTSRSSHVVSLYKSTTLMDEETVPINKSTNGTNGTDGTDGNDGEDGISTINYYKWGTTSPSKPSDTSLSGSGALPCPSGWSTQCEDQMMFINPNSSTYLDWTAQTDGTRKLVATTTGTFKQAELIKVVLPTGGKVDIRASILSEANYDFIYVSPLFSSESAAKSDLATFLSVCTRYAYIETNGYDPDRAAKGLGYTTLNTKNVAAQNAGSFGTYYLYVAYVKDSSDSSSPSGWTGGYAEYEPSLDGSLMRYAVSGTGTLTHSGSNYSFSDITWSEVFAYANRGMEGLEHRTSAWRSGVEYRNDSGKAGTPRCIDYCYNKALSMIGDSDFVAYRCIKTHVSSDEIPLGTSGYWERVNNMAPIVTALVLASKIRADFIDVETIAANSAFINVLNTQVLNARKVNTAETGNGHIVMEDDSLRMFNSSGEERLVITGDALSYLNSASTTGPSSQVNLNFSQTVPHQTADEKDYTGNTTIMSTTISEDRILSVPAVSLNVYGGFTSNDPSLVTYQPIYYSVYVRWFDNDDEIAEVTYFGLCYSDSQTENSFSKYITLPAYNVKVSSGSHVIKVVYEIELYNTNQGIISGNNFAISIYGTVAKNSILLSSSVLKTEIANNGFRAALSADVYALVQLSGNTNNIEFRNGNYGIRIRSDGIYATKTGANGWTNVTTKLLP